MGERARAPFYICTCMRKPRQLQEGALYHVTARANRKEMIFNPDRMKELFLAVLMRAKAKYAFRLENFCIMGNHYHLVIRPEGSTNLSRLMQWIMSVFAMAYNRIHHLTGHVWGERFYSRILDGFRAFQAVFSYVDDNPVHAHLAEDRRDWRYGGLWHHRSGMIDLCNSLVASRWLSFPEHAQPALVRL